MNRVSNRIPDDIAQLLIDPAAHADGRIHEGHYWSRANMPLGVAEVDVMRTGIAI